MYFDYILESEDTVLTNKIIENSIYEMCVNGGDSIITDVEDYINLLEDKDHEPTVEFDDFIFENLSPYLEENAKYLGMFLFEYISPEEKRERMDRLEKTRSPKQQAKVHNVQFDLDKKYPHIDSIQKRQDEIHGKEKADEIRNRTWKINKSKRDQKSLAKSEQESSKISEQPKKSTETPVSKEQPKKSTETPVSKEQPKKATETPVSKEQPKNNSIKAVANREAVQRRKDKIGGGDNLAAHNKDRRTALLTGKSKLNTIDSMKKGLQKAKMKLGGKVLTGAKRFANKVGTGSMLGKAASVVGSMGKKVAQSGGTGRRALNNKVTGK